MMIVWKMKGQKKDIEIPRGHKNKKKRKEGFGK